MWQYKEHDWSTGELIHTNACWYQRSPYKIEMRPKGKKKCFSEKRRGIPLDGDDISIIFCENYHIIRELHIVIYLVSSKLLRTKYLKMFFR